MQATLDLLRQFARGLGARLGLFAVLALVARWPALRMAGRMNDFRDAHVLASYEEAARRAVASYGELGLWDPWYCGGMDALGSPQARHASPTFLLTLVFGTFRAEAIVAFLMIVIACEGAYRYARSHGALPLGAAVAAPVFGLSGVFAHASALGWTNFYGFALVPWIAFGARRAMQGSLRGVVVGALAAAWMIGMGGTYSAPLTAVLCAFEVTTGLAARARSPRRMALAAVMALALAALGAGLAAIRLWPVASLLAQSPRLVGGTPGSSVSDLRAMLLSAPPKDQLTFAIGALAAPIVIVGATRRRGAVPLAMGLLFLWLAAGYTPRPSLFDLLREMPLYSMLRYPERFLIPFAALAAVLAALGVTALDRLAPRVLGVAWRDALVLGACALLLGNVGQLARRHWTEIAGTTYVAVPAEAPRPFQQARGNRWALLEYAPMGRGSLSCSENFPVPQSPALRGDLPADERLADPAAGTVTRTTWAPSRVALDVDLARPGRVLMNQNWHAGWRASAGEIVSDGGQLAVDLPAGRRELVLRYAPRAVVGGALATLAGLAACAFLLARARRGDRVRLRRAPVLLVALAPLVPALAVAAVVHEKTAPSSLAGADGTPLVAAVLPSDARHLGVRFAGGVVLEGAHVEVDPTESPPRARIELDWRLDGEVAPGLGIFMHVQGPKKMLNGDHVLLSSAVPIDDAPRGVVLRDRMILELPGKDASGPWKVWMGLWRARRDGTRVPVVTRGFATVEDNRVEVGAFQL